MVFQEAAGLSGSMTCAATNMNLQETSSSKIHKSFEGTQMVWATMKSEASFEPSAQSSRLVSRAYMVKRGPS